MSKTTKPSTILIVDDEDDVRKLVSTSLAQAGYETTEASTGEEALEQIAEASPDLVMLDLVLPGISGTDVCRRLKMDPDTRHIPILILSALGDEIDRVVAFELGVDDYVVKPFFVRELVLRIRAILKRASTTPDTPLDDLNFGTLRIDRRRHRAWVDDTELHFTALEFKLLSTFVSNRGRVQSRESLLEDVWGVNADVTTRTVDTHVKRLREKLGEHAKFLQTVRGVGYRFAEMP